MQYKIDLWNDGDPPVGIQPDDMSVIIWSDTFENAEAMAKELMVTLSDYTQCVLTCWEVQPYVQDGLNSILRQLALVTERPETEQDEDSSTLVCSHCNVTFRNRHNISDVSLHKPWCQWRIAMHMVNPEEVKGAAL